MAGAGTRLAEQVGTRGKRRAEAAQQRGALVEPNERIAAVTWKCCASVAASIPRSASQSQRHGTRGSDENAPAWNIARLAIASPSERAEYESARCVAIAPCGAGAGVEQHAHRREVDRCACALQRIGRQLRCQFLPAVNAAHDKVPPAAVIGNAQVGIGLAGHLRDGVSDNAPAGPARW